MVTSAPFANPANSTVPVPQFLRVSENLKNGTTFLLLIDIASLDNIIHETRLPGGFRRLVFEIPTTDAEYRVWSEDRLMAHLVMEESATRTIWEGRLEEVTLVGVGRTRLTFTGYWTVFRHHVDNDDNEVKDYSTGADTWITNLLAELHTDEVALTAGTLAAPGVTIDQTYPEDWTYWQALTDTRQGVLSFGDTSGNKTDLAVWEGRQVDLTIRTSLSVTWRALLGTGQGERVIPGGVRKLPLSTPFQPVRNAVDAIYDTGGGDLKAGYTVDQTSIDKYVRVEHVIPSLGTTVLGTAQARQAEYLEQSKDPQQEIGGIVLDKVYDSNLIEQPLCHVRAGDVLYITDWQIESSLDNANPVLDAQRIFFIESTKCDHRTGTVTIRPDRESGSVANMLVNNRVRAKI